MATTRWAAWIWYRGHRFSGFQAQPDGQTVQQTIGRALAGVGLDYRVMPAGRTDRGVHARMQVLSFRAPAALPREGLEEALRRAGPEDALGLVALKRPAPAFHAQWSATGKEYRYRLALGPATPPKWAPFAWHVTSDARLEGAAFDVATFAAALRRAEGTRDFSAFHAKSSVRKPRTLRRATVVELAGGIVEARLEGEGFARFQVRYLVGAAALVASGRLSEPNYVDALERAAIIEGVRAPPSALVLWDVRYPEALDPFTEQERRSAPGVPEAPPFGSAPGRATG